MSNEYTPNPDSDEFDLADGGVSSNGSSFVSRRELRASNVTGALPALEPLPIPARTYSGSPELEHLIQSLHDLFERDRQVASQHTATRCGICYLYFSVDALSYRDGGFYICEACERALGNQHITMLRNQQKL